MWMKTILGIVVAVSLCLVSARATALQGTPAFSTTPASVDLGPSAVGVATPVFAPPPFFQPLQINDPGTAPLTFTYSFSSPEFSFDPNTNLVNPVTVAAGSSVTGGLQFKPSAAGARKGEFISNDNAPGSPRYGPTDGDRDDDSEQRLWGGSGSRSSGNNYSQGGTNSLVHHLVPGRTRIEYAYKRRRPDSMYRWPIWNHVYSKPTGVLRLGCQW